MPPSRRNRFLASVIAFAGLLTGTLALAAQPPGADPLKKIADPPKANDTKDTKPQLVKLPDGTFLWLGTTENGERVTLTPAEFQKLLDRVDQLKKELAARKPVSPSNCAIRGRIEKRGEQLVASLKLTFTFRTTQTNSAVALGGRKAFMVNASLDGAKLPVLDTGEDGFAVLVEAVGDHTLALEMESPVTARGAKAEVGFDIGLPRAPITTLALEPPSADVKRMTVIAKTPDPTQPAKPPETRRLVNLDVKQLAKPDAGLPLGPIDSLEVTWDPPASVAQPADQVQSAELDVSVILTEGYVESTAKIKLRGPSREWKLVAPAIADVSVDRVVALPGETGPTQQPVVSKPSDANKPAWKIELPTGSTGADWIVTAVVRQARPKAGAPKSSPSAVGPFAMLDVLRQTGTVQVKAGPNTRFAFKHSPDLRRAEVPGTPDDEVSAAFFRLTTGPTGNAVNNTPLLTVEAWPVEGAVRVRPTYKLELTDAGWKIRAELNVKPIRTEVESIVIEVPAEWRGLESEYDPERVQSVTPAKAEGAFAPVTVRLANPTKQPFSVVLLGTIPTVAMVREAAIPLPRFPKSVERDAGLLATVPDGWELHGNTRAWDGEQVSTLATPLVAVPGADGKTPKAVTAISGKAELGFARANLIWQQYRPDVSTEMKVDVSIGERQIVVSQQFRFRSPDGFPKPIRLRAPNGIVGLERPQSLEPSGIGVWQFAPPVESKDATLKLSFAIPLAEESQLPIGMFWPTDANAVQVNARVWLNALTGRTVSTASPGWRELPPEIVPDRAALPSLTLAASEEHALTLDLRQTTPESAVGVWVERSLIEAGMTEDGAVNYRARFRLQRWLTPAIEVWLPNAIGPNPTAIVNGATTSLLPLGESENGRRFRVNLPDIPSGRGAVLELQYSLPGTRHVLGETLYQPPRVLSAAYSGSVRWLITEPSDAAPLLFAPRARAEIRWRLRGPLLAPSATARADLERWFSSGDELVTSGLVNAQDGEPLVARQTVPEAVRVLRAPWLALVIACSLFAFLVLVLLTWLSTTAAGIVTVLLSASGGLFAVLYPQPAAQMLAASQPGIVLGLLVFIVQTVLRWRARHQATNLPGFTRVPRESTTTGSAIPDGVSAPNATPSASSRNRAGGSGVTA